MPEVLHKQHKFHLRSVFIFNIYIYYIYYIMIKPKSTLILILLRSNEEVKIERMESLGRWWRRRKQRLLHCIRRWYKWHSLVMWIERIWVCICRMLRRWLIEVCMPTSICRAVSEWWWKLCW